MKERPSLFSGPMVRAILDGSKTQTRRVMKPQPADNFYPLDVGRYHPLRVGRNGEEYPAPERFGAYDDQSDYPCPYGAPGDRLWVRETWGLTVGTDETDWHRHSVKGADDRILGHWRPQYRADWGPVQEVCFWRPSIHMPRWASRLALDVVSVRVERLQDISEADAIAEGISRHAAGWTDGTAGYDTVTARQAYRELWESINGAGSWDANPWVWVIGFTRTDGGER